ncbi:polysaccharide deacetylase family protein [Aquiflexum sp. LQ15W]|uniref:polysaccharide deacetylase family protein n=1 Tax=Cognataquiflexum nitidum TaxID=2922272 RepID=UPI001F133667|nr:polysaccharide deacetylase family protein [Cognataquiflexum nitidum]MCH6198791.1 polysaccharide deacetylase family protein [Cognataquiflexum nitidum]
MVWMHHVPSLIPKVFDKFIWNKNRDEKNLYLTFDDGPVPGITDFVLNELSKRDMKATFFMVGANVEKHPNLAKEVLQAGNGIGNHTFNHLDGYRNPDALYLENIEKCQKILQDTLEVSPVNFRPPYGKISKSQSKLVLSNHQIVMWDVLSGDYDPEQSIEKCLYKTMKYSRNGSIVLFHDQQKTEWVVKKVLPDYLDFIKDKGFQTGLL